MEQVAEVAASFSRGALLAKIDNIMESAYRLVPVHPVDHPLQAMWWKNAVCVDPMLLFSFQSAPKLFNCVADALEWHVHHQGVQHIFHYQMTLLLWGQQNSVQRHYSSWTGSVEDLASLSPTTSRKVPPLVWLRFTLDTVAFQLWLPEDRLLGLKTELNEWGDCKVYPWKELESFIGLLNHACKVHVCEVGEIVLETYD